VLGEKYDSRVAAATYEISGPTIDSQIVKLKASGADVFVIAATPKFAAQSIRHSVVAPRRGSVARPGRQRLIQKHDIRKSGCRFSEKTLLKRRSRLDF
jgi:hypothetical protein